MLEQIHENLFTIALPLRMPGGVQFGTRTSVVRLADGGLFVHSPGPASDEDVRAIDALGEVRHLVAPNLFHHLYVRDWMARCEGASLHGPPGLEQKLPGVPFTLLTDSAPPAWQDDLDQVAVRGMPRVNEIVFAHRASRTLLLTDLCFNLVRVDSAWTRVFLGIMGAYGRFGPSRLARFFMKDKKQVKADIERVLALDFDRVLVTHGDVVETGGREALREAYAAIG